MEPMPVVTNEQAKFWLFLLVELFTLAVVWTLFRRVKSGRKRILWPIIAVFVTVVVLSLLHGVLFGMFST